MNIRPWSRFPSIVHVENVYRQWLLCCFFEDNQLPGEVVTHQIMPLVCSLYNIRVWATRSVCVGGLYEAQTFKEESVNFYYSPLVNTMLPMFDIKCSPTFMYNNRKFNVCRKLHYKPHEYTLHDDHYWAREYVISDTMTFYTLTLWIQK